MKKWIIPFINLILYSNFFIALCAVALTFQTQLIEFNTLKLDNSIGLAFFATLLIYALHRLVALQKVQKFTNEGRYLVINSYKSHIWIYALLGLLGSIYFFFQMSWNVQFSLVIPGLISLAYVLPVIGKQKKLRLRDLDGIKIFLVAGVWAYVTVILPILEYTTLGWQHFLLFQERAFFIFAITLPFDIRDLKIDKDINTRTIPALIGTPKTLQLVLCILLGAWLLASLNYWLFGVYDEIGLIALGISISSTYIFVKIATRQEHDYYYTGLIDGTMILQFLLFWGLLTFDL